MGHYRISKKVRRKKVADLAAKSRMYSVNNCTIQHIDNNTETVTGEDGRKYVVGKVLKWKKEHHVQPKRLRKACWKVYFVKEEHDYLGTAVWVRHAEKMKSEYPQVSSTKLTRAELIEGLIKEKIKKWELKHPCPAKDDDLFKEEYIPKWKKEREEALEHFRDFVVSVYHKLKIVGYRLDSDNYCVKPNAVTYVKDEDMKGHHVKHPDFKTTDKLWKTATNAAQKAMDKDHTIIDCALLNHNETEIMPLYEAKRRKKAA